MDTRGSNGYLQQLKGHASGAIRSGDSTCSYAFFGPSSTRDHVANLCQALNPQRHLVNSSKSDLELRKELSRSWFVRWTLPTNGEWRLPGSLALFLIRAWMA